MNYVVDTLGVLVGVPIGVYNKTLQQYSPYERAVMWPGGTTDVPVDFLPGIRLHGVKLHSCLLVCFLRWCCREP